MSRIGIESAIIVVGRVKGGISVKVVAEVNAEKKKGKGSPQFAGSDMDLSALMGRLKCAGETLTNNRAAFSVTESASRMPCGTTRLCGTGQTWRPSFPLTEHTVKQC